MPRMSLQDASFLSLESDLTPTHITMMMTFRFPAAAPTDYIAQLRAHLRRFPVRAAPFNYLLVPTSSTRPPNWDVADAVDLDYHLRHHRLPGPGGERELGEVVSNLHSQQLDQTRPMWELHLIESRTLPKFWLCLKIHHAMADGMSMVHIMERMFVKSASGKGRPPWAVVHASKAPTAAGTSGQNEWRQFFEGLIKRTGKRSLHKEQPSPRGPRTALNGPITGRRRFATQNLSLARVKALARAADATVNDVVLAICSGALRSFLQEFDKLPERSLVAGIPIAVPHNESQRSGNSVGGLIVSLASDITDLRLRLATIRGSTQAAKSRNSRLPAAVSRTFSTLGNYMMSARSPDTSERVADRQRVINLVISNMPGPAQPRYLYGAALQSIHTASVLMLDQRLNITLLSCRGELNFGLTGCSDTLPHIQRIAVLLPEAMRELEQAYNIAG